MNRPPQIGRRRLLKTIPLALLCALASCSPVHVGEEVYAHDGTRVGTVIETGYHSFKNGLSAKSIHVRNASDGTDFWSPRDVFANEFEVRKKK
jgi:hypothetical protein